MPEVHLFVALLVAVVLLALFARRLRLSEEVALVVGGLALGALPFAPDVQLDPEVIFLVFLPPILYPFAFQFASEDVRGNLRPIGLLAFGLVLATMLAIAAVLHLVAGIPWAAAFVAGAILSPTDPVAATAVLRKAGAPERLTTILEGESLINDGTGLTALRIAVSAVGAGTLAPGSVVLDFLAIAAGGAAIGAALGLATSYLRRRLDDLALESSIAVLLAYGSFMLAEELGASGILATVLAGFVMGHRARLVVSPETRAGGAGFWGVARFLSESILFLLIGLAFAQVLDEDFSRSGLELAGLVLLVSAVTLGIRFLWMWTVPYVVGILDRDGWRPGTLYSGRERTVLALGGMRGAVSVAAALTIPVTAAGEPFPERNALLVVVLGSIVVLLIGPTLALPRALRALGMEGADGAERREREARVELARAALARMEELEQRHDLPEEVLRRIRERYEWRVAHERDDPDEGALAAAYRDVRKDLLEAERHKLVELEDQGAVAGAALRAIERDLDLEETRIG